MYGVQSWLLASHSGGGFFSRSLLIIVASESSSTIVRSKSNTAKDAMFSKCARNLPQSRGQWLTMVFYITTILWHKPCVILSWHCCANTEFFKNFLLRFVSARKLIVKIGYFCSFPYYTDYRLSRMAETENDVR